MMAPPSPPLKFLVRSQVGAPLRIRDPIAPPAVAIVVKGVAALQEIAVVRNDGASFASAQVLGPISGWRPPADKRSHRPSGRGHCCERRSSASGNRRRPK